MSIDFNDEPDSAELAAEQGFTGTLAGFLLWLESVLVYGGITRSSIVVDQWGRERIDVRTITAGFSSDEHLLGRVQRHSLLRMFWESSHAGGLTVYRLSMAQLSSDEEQEWLPADDGSFETIYRARELVVVGTDGEEVRMALPQGAKLRFTEPRRDILEPAGVLHIEPLEKTSWGRNETEEGTSPSLEELMGVTAEAATTEEEAR